MSDPLSSFANETDDIKERTDVSENMGKSSGGSNNDGDTSSEHLLTEPCSQQDEKIEEPKKPGELQRPDSAISDNSDLLAKIEEEMGEEPKDLVVSVDNPEKIIKTMESYIAFTVKTKTTRSDFEDPEYSVKRRYNDFLWLRQQLEQKYPVQIIPPLPEKHSLTIDRFDKEFLKFRKVALHRFMARLAQHPTFSKDELVKAFLTLETTEFQNCKKQGAGLISRVTKSISTKGISLMLKNRSEEYTSLYEYAQSLGNKMGAFERISVRVAAEQTDYLGALAGYTTTFENWASSESDLSCALGEMSKLLLALHDDYKEMVDEIPLKTLLPAKEYALFADSIKNSLTRRDAVQHELEVINEELVKLAEERKQLEVNPSSGGFLSRSTSEEAVQAKTEKLSTRITELEGAHAQCKTKLDTVNSLLKADLERWHVNKKTDMREMIGGMADRSIAAYDKQIKSLEVTLNQLKENMAAQQSAEDADGAQA